MDYCFYGDESCHLENDGIKPMALGGIWCAKQKRIRIAQELREIKRRHNLSPHGFELKWTSVSPSKLDYFLEVLEYFFSSDELNYRAVLVPDKEKLRHSDFDQTHIEWIHKIWYDCIKHILNGDNVYNIYIDLIDCYSNERAKVLRECLVKFLIRDGRNPNNVGYIQNVNSQQIELLQLADFLTGAICHGQRTGMESQAKRLIVKRFQEEVNMSSWRTNRIGDVKFSLLVWKPS
ncbi:MAG TPA: DUF3800 domain-containing protein [Saccharofermentans sp.]|nr:DUF3800 domain-containing protein [Saccharofermentans sp.]